MNFLADSTRVENVCAAVDPHCIGVKSEIFVIIKINKTNKTFVILELKNVLLGIFVVLLVHYDQLANAQIISNNWE
jgi:hypothetical protein